MSELFAKANEAYDKGEYLTAIDLLDDAISKGLSSVVAYINKGAALDALGRREAAAKCYRAAISCSSSYELAWHNLGNSLFAQERFGRAARAYSRASRLNPDRVENLVGLAESLIENGSVRRARTAIERMSRAAEKDSSLLLLQADLHVRARDGDAAIERCKKYTSLSPNDALGHANLGGVLHELGDFKGAIRSFERALKLTPDDPQTWNNFGYSCYCDGQTDRALAAFDRAIEISPDYKHAWYNKGYSLHGVDRLDEAVKCYERALEIDPVDPVLLNNIGNALYNLGRYADSLPCFVEAIDVDPDYEIAWNNIGNALEKMERYADAVPFHDRSLEIRPDFDYALYAKGVCKAELGDVEEGYELLLESLDLNPSYDEAWRARAQIAQRLGRMDDSLSSVDVALTLNPLLCDAWVERGDMLARMKDGAGANTSYARALGCAEQMVLQSPFDGDPWRIKSSVLLRLGRYHEALEAAVRAMTSRHPDMTAMPLAFDICQTADVSEPPQELVDIAERQKEIGMVLPYAAFLAARGGWASVVEKLAAFSIEDMDSSGRAMLVQALVNTGVRTEAIDVASRSPASERSRLLAEVESASGDWKKAIAHFRAAVAHAPGDYLAAIGLAKALLNVGMHDDAVAAATLAAGVDPLEWEPHETMAEAFESLGERKRANYAHERAEELRARCYAPARGGRSKGVKQHERAKNA